MRPGIRDVLGDDSSRWKVLSGVLYCQGSRQHPQHSQKSRQGPNETSSEKEMEQWFRRRTKNEEYRECRIRELFISKKQDKLVATIQVANDSFYSFLLNTENHSTTQQKKLLSASLRAESGQYVQVIMNEDLKVLIRPYIHIEEITERRRYDYGDDWSDEISVKNKILFE